MSALDRLKCIQNNFRQQWHGINCEISGRPGKSSITLYFFRFSPSLTVVARKDEIGADSILNFCICFSNQLWVKNALNLIT